ncbi:Spc98 family-domain-containing protein [Crepidotus variabilis]|uniref:Spc98 family-domain-containing protein n=1 Tax=Crepidotus variabilis TaxID=179855 RepID=A0A9P6ESJ7_9AGAR|nr:Spc98 family-domain-containing protein [Crepidotus variabilis]
MSLPSSSSSLSVKTQGLTRPPSGLSSRPPSRNTARTPTNAQRPTSSLSVNRPGSSASTRPQSRFSHRPNSRHARSRLVPICQALVTLITGLKEEGIDEDAGGEIFQEKVEYAVRSLETTTINKAAAGVDLSVIDRHIRGLALKARINSQDPLSKALESSYKSLKAHIEQQETDLDQDIKTAHIPDHLQLLLALSQTPTDVTIEKAKIYLEAVVNPPPPPPNLTWADILAEEPFEGEHWEGIFPAPQKDSPTDEWDSTPSLSPLNSDDLALDDEDDSFSSHSYEKQQHNYTEEDPDDTHDNTTGNNVVPYSFEHRRQFEELQSRQYWRDDWQTDVVLNTQFNIGDPSTLGPTLNRVLVESRGSQDAQALLGPERYINEDDMVREILMALRGNRNIVLAWREGAFTTVPNTPRLVHFSLASQESIISSLGKIATTVEHLRRFASTILNISIAPVSSAPQLKKMGITRTCEAFADAVSNTVRGLEAWCSAREEAMCRAYSGFEEEPLVVSLLNTEKSLHDQYAASFDVLLDIVRTVFEDKPQQDPDTVGLESGPAATTLGQKNPAGLMAFLLDTLFSNVQRHLERGETTTSDALMSVFVRTAEPIWSMLGGWLKHGMGLGLGVGTGGIAGATDELDDEFFIESSGVGIGMMGLGLLDPEFWQEGYVRREVAWSGDDKFGSTRERKATPLFLEHVAELVLRTGKAVGLLRALDGLRKDSGLKKWESFAQLVSLKDTVTMAQGKNNTGLFSVSVDTLSRLIHDELLPHCEFIGAKLVKVLIDDCMLWKHLRAIEDIFLMRKGDAMSNFVDVVFTKMDTHQSWSDFHFLNTAFGDVVDSTAEADKTGWVNVSLVRFSYRGNKEKERSVKRTIKAIDGLVLEYAVPFPLIYIFQPRTIQGYNEIFVFLLQIRRAKSVLERILVRDERGRGKKLKEELKVFYAMRSRLSWFINTLLNFLTTYVLHAEVLRFHLGFEQMCSLDDMIQFHDDHLEKIRGRCLLKPNTSALHRAIIAILDMCLQFSEGFVTFAGDSTATLDLSRQSIIMKRHRSKRQRRQRRNVIGFSQFTEELEEDESSDEEDKDDLDTSVSFDELSGSGIGTSVNSADENPFVRVEKLSLELDGLVKFLRRGVESLAGGTSEAAAAFGVLAFALEDWDI